MCFFKPNPEIINIQNITYSCQFQLLNAMHKILETNSATYFSLNYFVMVEYSGWEQFYKIEFSLADNVKWTAQVKDSYDIKW